MVTSWREIYICDSDRDLPIGRLSSIVACMCLMGVNSNIRTHTHTHIQIYIYIYSYIYLLYRVNYSRRFNVLLMYYVLLLLNSIEWNIVQCSKQLLVRISCESDNIMCKSARISNRQVGCTYLPQFHVFNSIIVEHYRISYENVMFMFVIIFA